MSLHFSFQLSVQKGMAGWGGTTFVPRKDNWPDLNR